MTFRRLYADFAARVVALALLLFCANCPAQNVILHLRNGDRITGTILGEDSVKVIIATTWSKEVIVPLSQIERRETPTPVLTLTNVVVAGQTNLVAVMKPTALPPNTNTFWRRWSGEAAVGMDLERGATDHRLYYGKAKLAYAQPYASDPKQFYRNIVTYDLAYGKTDGTISDDRMNGTSKMDFDLSRKFYLYNLGGLGYDKVRLINLQYQEGPGVGYHWITKSNFVVNLELGADYEVEDRSDGTRTASAYYRLGQDLNWKITKDMNLTEKYEYLLRAGFAQQYRMRFESTLTYALLLHFSLNFSVIDLYDTQPAASIPNNDFQFRTSLGAKF